MAQTVLGFDLGSYSIKVAVFSTTFKSFLITDLYESRPLLIDEMSREEALASQRQALQRFLQDNQIPEGVSVGGFSGVRVSHRNLVLPFRNRKQIEKILPFELETYLPFALDDLVVDFNVSEQSKTTSRLLALAVKKEFLAQYLLLFDGSPFTPKIIDVDVVALANIAAISNVPVTGNVAIIDFGHQKTSLCILRNGRTAAIRTVYSAGKAVTDAIRMSLDLTYQQAEEVKHKYASIVSDQTLPQEPRQRKIIEAVRQVIDPVLIDIMQAIHNFEAATEEGGPIEAIYLCGGTSLIENLDRYCAELSGKQVELVRSTVGSNPLEDKIGKREAVMVQAMSLGLRFAMRGMASTRMSQVNLRRGEFASTQDYEELRSNVKYFGLLAGVIVALMLFKFIIGYFALSGQSKGYERQIVQQITEIIPDLPKNTITSSTKALNLLQGRIKEYNTKVDLITSGLKGITALDVLKEISSRIPTSLPLDIRELNIDRNKVFIKGDTDSFTSVDKIVEHLQQYPLFTKVEKGAIADAPDVNKKRFTITIEVGESEEGKKS